MNFLCNRIGFPKEASEYIYSIYNGITHDKKTFNELNLAKQSFLTPSSKDYTNHLAKISDDTGVHIYTINLILVLICAKYLKTQYDIKGISEEIYIDTMSDISYKLRECKKMHNIWGIFSLDWYRGVFSMKTIKLGRLEYEIKEFPLEDYKDYVKKGDIVYSCHIPSAGPLTPESVLDSLRRAYEFFGIKDKLIIYCRSWLLYPAHYNLYPEGSNLRAFYDSFDIVGEETPTTNLNLWRIFYRDPSTPYDELPTDTTLQRNFAKYLKDGNYIGIGVGMIVFDGEKIIN